MTIKDHICLVSMENLEEKKMNFTSRQSLPALMSTLSHMYDGEQIVVALVP